MPDHPLPFPESELVAAAQSGDADGVARWLAQGADPRANYGAAFNKAAENGHVACLQELLPFCAPEDNLVWPLIYAARQGQIGCAQFLARSGKADASHALRACAERGDVQAALILLPFADPSGVDNKGRGAGDYARGQGHEDLAGMVDAFFEAAALRDVLAPEAPASPRRTQSL